MLESALSPTNSSLLLYLLLVRLVIGLEVANLAHAIGVYWFISVRARRGFLELVSCMVTRIAHVPSYFIFVVMGTFDLLKFIRWASFVHVFIAKLNDIIKKV